MKIAFILPAIGKKRGEKYVKTWTMEPITIAVLRRLTPPRFECVFYDDRIEAVNYETDADIIAITVETYTARRAYAIARRFRERGKIVVMGGYHVTMLPGDAKPHADIIVQGNAEGVWAGILSDIESGSYRGEYIGLPRMDYGLPDRSIYQDKMDKYLPISLVEIGRGCHHNCEFCSIHSYYKCEYIHRSIPEIIEEIKQCKGKVYFFVDDSIFSDKAFAKELFTEVAKLNIIWVTQVTLDIAQDEELLRLMKKSGCELILIGFESIDPDNLRQMNKSWSVKLGERDELVQRIHRNGISIYASFVFGFDFDNERSFINCLEFCKKHQFFVTAYNHLLAFPGTGTYDRFAQEGRLLEDKWWLQEGYTFGTISYRPKLLTPSELSALCRRYKKRFFSFASIIERARTLKTRTDRASIVRAYWLANLLLHFEVDKRYGIPLGGNLDEVKNRMLRFEQAELEDGPALLSLIEAGAAKGAIELFYTRRPSPVASYRRESQSVSLAVLRDDAGRPNLMAANVLHRYFVGGEDREIGYMSGIRRRKDSYPRGNWLNALYTYEREHCRSCLFSILDDNAPVMTFFEKHKPRDVTIAPVCHYNTYMVNPKILKRFARRDLRVERVLPDQIDAVYSFLARHGRQYDFFPAVTDLEKQFSGLHWADCLAVWRKEQIVAFGALWEQTAYRQYIVKAYHGYMRTARAFSPILAAVGYIPIPPAGEVLKIATLTLMSAAGEDEGIYRALLGGLAEMARRRDIKILVIGLPETNYQSDIFRSVRHLSFGSHIYMLQDAGEASYAADGQPPHLECGWL